MYQTLIYQPILNTLLWFYNITGGNLGLAIILLTLLVRFVLIPFTLPSIRSAQKMTKIKPKLDELKRKHSKDPRRLQQEQVKLYKEHGINPVSGCLPYIVQFIFLIALYRVFIDSLGNGSINGQTINPQFLLWNLKDKDSTFILPVAAGVLQLFTSLALTPGAETHLTEKKKGESKEDVAEMAVAMQQQMVFLMPVITVVFALQFPSGLALYWVVTTAFSLVQQLVVSGPGGLKKYLIKLTPKR